ncbi:MAG: hypothetical protein ACOYJ1_15685, partial [Peptococcales bacterium]
KINCRHYSVLLNFILPRKVCLFIDLIIAFSLWVGLGVMLTASATLLKSHLNISLYLGFILTGLLVFFCLQFGSRGLMNTNTILVPILIILAIGSSLIYIYGPIECSAENVFFKTLLPNWWTASMLYVAYNMILGMVVLASLKDDIEKMTSWGGVIGGLILGVMALVMVKGLQLLPQNLFNSQMPMLALTAQISPIAGNIYAFGLWIALFTTALANAHSLTNRVSSLFRKSYKLFLLIILLTTLVFIPWQFSTLVGLLYPVEGYLAIPVIIAIVVAGFLILIE